MKKAFIISVIFCMVMLACKKNDSNPTNGTVEGTIINTQGGASLASANIEFFNAIDNSPTSYSTSSGADGKYSISITAGTYLIMISKQGYNSVPPIGIIAVPVVITAGVKTIASYQMVASSVSNAGYVTGRVLDGSTPKSGVLTIVSGNGSTFSGTTNTNGNFTIYNIPAGSYSVKGYLASYNSTSVNISVTQNTKAITADIVLSSGATGAVSGNVGFLATNNIDVDVSLVIPGTNSTIPGLTVKTSGGTYSMSHVPNGTYIARASWSNDNKVVDPDWILKNGEAYVTINSNSVILNFSLTGAVQINSPSNALTTTIPFDVSTITPAFSWNPYSSSDYYVIEVMDMNGATVWGGISGIPLTRKVMVAKTQTTVTYNFDGTGQPLQNGRTYRWRIYASKDDSGQPLGWKLISASEEQMGLFNVKL